MAEARTGCIAIIQWIWTLVKRPFSYTLHDSPDMVDMDASNQEETLFGVAADTSGPIQTIPKPIQLDNHASSSGCIASSSTATVSQNPDIKHKMEEDQFRAMSRLMQLRLFQFRMDEAKMNSLERPFSCLPKGFNHFSTSGPSVSNLQTITKSIQLDTRATSSGCVASSSTTIPARRWKYGVFLSFRGTDTRQGITVDIRDRLQSRGIKTFMDDPDLRKGDPISPTLMEAIERSRFAVLVLSPHYADSSW